MKDKSSTLPQGFKPVDKTALRGRLNELGTVEKSLQAIMVRDERHRSDRDVEEDSKPQFRRVKKLSDIISKNIQAANDLRSVTHYIKRAEQIWLTMLLKPNGDQKQLLGYDTESSDIKNTKLHADLLQVVENYANTKYPLEELPAQIIKDVLFRTGSYVLLNLPHSALDHLINGMEVSGQESLEIRKQILAEQFDNNLNKARNIGYIRKTPSKKFDGGFESLFDNKTEASTEFELVHPDLGWTFTDNPNVLKAGQLQQKLRHDTLRQRAGMETIQTMMSNIFTKEKGAKHTPNKNNVGIGEKKTINEALGKLYNQRNYRHNESLSVRKSRFYTGTGKGIGITYHVPSEACVPVHANGEIGKPFGHILLVDPASGEFLKSTTDMKYYQNRNQASEKLDNGSGYGSVNEMAGHIKRIATGGDCNFDMDWMVEFASATLEKEFCESFLNGDLNKSVTVSLSEHNKKLFLARAMRQQGVRCIFVPSEYVTYIATDFTHTGTGRSLVEEAKLMITRLAILDTADALAAVENSISKTELRITLEKHNTDPRQLVAMIRDEYFANNPTLHDIMGYNNVSIDAVLDRFKEQQLIVKVDAGDNKHIIAPQIEASQAVHEPLKSVEPSVKEGLLNGIAGHFMLKRSWLEDTGDGNEFAIEALADQELLRNQSTAYSREFGRFLSDFLRKHIKCNEPLMRELVEIIRDNKKLYEKPDQYKNIKDALEEEYQSASEQEMVELILIDFLNNLYVELPQMAITETLSKIDSKIDAIDKLVERWMEMAGAKLIKEHAERFNLEPEELANQIKGVFMFEAFERFNIPTPFEAILNNGDGGGILSIVNSIANLDANVAKFFEAHLTNTSKGKKVWDKLVEKFGETEEEVPGQEEQVDPSMSFDDTDPFAEEQLPEGDPDLTNTDDVESEEKEPDLEEEEKATDDTDETVDEDQTKGEEEPFDKIELPPES